MLFLVGRTRTRTRTRTHPPQNQINPQIQSHHHHPLFSLHHFHLNHKHQHQHQHQIPHSSSNPQHRNPAPPSELGDGLVLVAEFSSPHNHIRVVDHPPLPSSLPPPRSHLHLLRPLRLAPPILPPGPRPLGFGAGSAARLVLALHPGARIHGYELDPCVLAFARRFFALADLEARHPLRLTVHEADALAGPAASVPGGFAGLMVDLFLRGSVVPELQDAATWAALKGRVRDGGRVMVNLGGRCVEAEEAEERRDGDAVMRATLGAMREAFGAHQVFVLSLGRGGGDDDSFVALTGPLPNSEQWKRKLPPALRGYVDLWRPCSDLLR
ncbi:hypothetical protein ACMD2_17041 [Ananas comosus]|uniref:Methyltransferase-like protein 13 n=1 Tax=Ananas comosus TaxID=4615 RepID=A0A199UNT5_ANACO|nr:hypothetical protein ACMD2_17041 [Ananas comosus]